MLKLINISKERVFMKFWQYTREMIFHQKVIIEMSDSDDTIVGDLEDLGPSSMSENSKRSIFLLQINIL